MTAPASLKWRLLLAGASGVMLAALTGAWLLGAAFERSALGALDRRLGDDLDTLIALVERRDDGRIALRREPVDERYERVFSGWYWAIDLQGAQRVSRSSWDEATWASALTRASAVRQLSQAAGPSDQTLRIASQRIRFSNGGAEAALAAAGDLAEVRAEAREFRVFAAVAIALIALILLLAIACQVGFGLRPLHRVKETLLRLRSGEDVRFEAASLPLEVAPLATQINDLLNEHDRRVSRARHAVHDLAHALKTPLAALALDAQGDNSELARTVSEQVARMRATVDRQLAGGLVADSRQRTPVLPVVAALTRLMKRAHASRPVPIGIDTEVDATAIFSGSLEDLEEMLGNLLDNACKWAASTVLISSTRVGDGLLIRIDDDGPGLDADQIERAMQRGSRLDEQAPGSGLGLDIVHSLATSYGGSLRLHRSPAGGLRAELILASASSGVT